jgi:UDP-N-acetylmuramoylalanine--D-glutamate ligase
LRESVPGAEFLAGAFSASLLEGIDFVAVSPGLMPNRELAAIIPAASERGIPVWGEIELFAQALTVLKSERGYAPKLIAITGTNGKTTVTSMVGLLCRRAGLTVQVAGNISPAALDVLRKVLEEDALPQVWVLELSSFQLHTTFSLNPDAAAVLNLTQDHLDWHDGMDDYAAAKARIFGDSTVRVLNRNDKRVMEMSSPASPAVTFGTDSPAQQGSFGLHMERDLQWLCIAVAAESDAKPRRKGGIINEQAPLVINRLMPANALKVQGQHNASNALAALALCRAIGLPLAPLLHALREYQGEPHRVELVTTVGGVAWFDDSKGTNVGATVAALQGLGASRREKPKSIVLIAGGDGKDQDFSPLAEPVRHYVRVVLLIGKDADRIQAALLDTGAELIRCRTLEEAVQRAGTAALTGDIVLLSPACASLDMFRNYAHRAQVFVDAVREIALSRGEVMP